MNGTKNRSLSLAALTLLAFACPVPAQLDALRNLAFGADTAEAPKVVPYFAIKGPLSETPVNMPPLFGGAPPQSLKSMLERLKEARLDSNVVAVVVDLQYAALGFGQLQEIHASLRKFAAVDKDVYLHADSLATGTYAAATAASSISMVPTGDLWLTGLYGETPYLRGALDRVGCVADFLHCGDYKTAAEPLTNTGPSEASRKMSDWLMDGIYGDVVKLIAKGRSLSEDKVRALIDGGPYSAEEALKLGLIDSVQHRQDFVAELKARFGDSVSIDSEYGKHDPFEIPDDNFFAMMEFFMKLLNPTPVEYTEPTIAIVYVEGTIQTGQAEASPFGTAAGAYSTTIRKALDRAASEDAVKAVVLRIDSPGGSALASEIILNASKRVVAAGKPVVVSMGNVAASGGYYVTCASETIFADSGTITASIGVVGGKIVTTGLWNMLGVNWHPTQRGEMAAVMSTSSKFSDKERAKIWHYMTSVYDVFKNHVVAARGKRLKKPIDEMAGGRVYTGRQALELGLVDKIGGLEDALKFAAKTANLSEYDVRVIPEPASILDMFGGQAKDQSISIASKAGFSLAEMPLFKTMLPAVAKVDPLRARAFVRALQRLQLIHDEHVVMMAPEMLIR